MNSARRAMAGSIAAMLAVSLIALTPLTADATPPQGGVNDPAADAGTGNTQTHPSVACNNASPTGTCLSFFVDTGSFNGINDNYLGWSKSINGGRDWTDQGAFPFNDVGGDPVVLYDQLADRWLMTQFNAARTVLRTFTSPDATVFTERAPASGPAVGGIIRSLASVTDGYYGALFRDHMYASYTENNGSPNTAVKVTHTTDGGVTWTPAVLAAADGFFPKVNVGRNGDVFITFNTNFVGNHSDIYIRRSTNGGATFGAPVKVATVNDQFNSFNTKRGAMFPINSPSLFPFGAHSVGVAYTDTNTAGYPVPFLAVSSNLGQTWGPPHPVANMVRPAIVTGGFYTGGRVGIEFYDVVRNILSGSPISSDEVQLIPNIFLGTPNAAGTAISFSKFVIGTPFPSSVAQDPAFQNNFADTRFWDSSSAFAQDGYGTHTIRTNFTHVLRNNRYLPNADVTSTYFSPAITSLTADVAASQIPPADPVNVGQPRAWLLRATNRGPSSAAFPSILDVFPANVRPVSVAASSGSCSVNDQMVGCVFGSLNSGATATATVSVVPVATGQLTNVLRASSAARDVVPANNVSSASVFSGGAMTTNTFSSGDVGVAIPDNTQAGVDQQVAVGGLPSNIINVVAKLRLDHTSDRELTMTLDGPGALTPLSLAIARGGTFDNYGSGAQNCSGTPARFDDAGPTFIGLGSAPFAAGPYIPEVPLLPFVGMSMASGTWTFNLADTSPAQTGTLYCAMLDITHDQPSVRFLHTTFPAIEGTSAIVTVVRAGDATDPLDVNYATNPATASTSDYTDTFGSLHFNAGETTKTFPVPITQDALVENAESIDLELIGPTSGVLGAPSALGETHLVIGANDLFRPDGLTRAAGGSYVGGNRYNATGSGQTATVSAARGANKVFNLLVQNDGNQVQSFRVRGGGNATGFTVGYFLGSANVTSAVEHGTLRVNNLGVGRSVAMTVKVHVSSSAAHGSSFNDAIRLTSVESPARVDLVRDIVRVP
jgi:hypothetical protein